MNSDTLQSTFPSRLLTLSDGRPGLRGAIHVETCPPTDTQPSAKDPQPILDFVSSDETLDRYGEIISAAGWKLDNYLRNPIFQNSHQYGDIIFTLGKALLTEVREVGRVAPNAPPRMALFQRIEFAVDANPMARIAYALYSRGFLNTVSVGFIPLRWEDGPPREAPDKLSTLNSPPPTNFRRRFLDQELLEVSAVAIPANPNALALALKSGAVEKSDLRDTLDLLRHALDPLPQPSAIVLQPLFQLARQLRDLMRST